MYSFGRRTPRKLRMSVGLVSSKVVKTIMKKPIPQFDLRELPLIKNQLISDVIDKSFVNKYGGLLVIISPPGSGKSTYLRERSNNFLNSGGYVQFFSTEMKSTDVFFESFGGKERLTDLFNVMPEKSVIIFDQLEGQFPLNADMKYLLRHLTLESRRVANRNIVVSTSSVESAKEILSLNGTDKIRQAGKCKDFMWGPDLIDAFIRQSPLSQLSKVNQSRIRQHAIQAACPAFLYTVANLCPNYEDEIFAKYSETLRRTWEQFEKAGF